MHGLAVTDAGEDKEANGAVISNSLALRSNFLYACILHVSVFLRAYALK